MTKVLYLSHNGMTEPLGQSQVLPYLRGLARGGYTIDLLACEPHGAGPERIVAMKARLAAEHIRYTPLIRRPSHSLMDKLRDSANLLYGAVRRIGLDKQTILHARGQLSAAVAGALRAALPGGRFIFDCRGLLADEYVDMGHWHPGEMRHRLTTAVEQRLFQSADKVVVLTEAFRDEVCGRGGALHGRPDDVAVIPCCADTERFRPDPVARARVRSTLGLSEETPVLLFAGSFARYDMDAALRFLRALRRLSDARFLLLTRSPAKEVLAQAQHLGLHEVTLHRAATPEEVPAYLAACDLAVSYLQRWRSSIATCPTKVGEYLAAGLPTAVTAHVGDGGRLRAPGLYAVNPDDEGALEGLAERMLDELKDASRARAAARQTALGHFSLLHVGVARYRALYEQFA